MFCPRCKEEIPADARECPSCRAELVSPDYRRTRTSGMAIASLVLALTCVGALIALPLGIAAQVQISRRRNELTGSGLAIAGMCISGVTLVFLLPMLAMLFPVFARAREASRKAYCLTNVKNISLGLQMYAADYGEFPAPAGRWQDSLEDYVKSEQVFTCPDYPQHRSAFAYMGDLAGRKSEKMSSPETHIAVFESDQGWNAAGDLGILPGVPRHMGGDNYGYADGHAKWKPRRGLANGRTVPGGPN